LKNLSHLGVSPSLPGDNSDNPKKKKGTKQSNLYDGFDAPKNGFYQDYEGPMNSRLRLTKWMSKSVNSRQRLSRRLFNWHR
jgi:hypothetical protein